MVVGLILTALSAAYQRNRMKKMQAKMDAEAEKRKGFTFTVEGEPIHLPLVYGFQKIGGVRTYHKIRKDRTTNSVTAEFIRFVAGTHPPYWSSDKNQILVIQQALCFGGIDGIIDVTVDNENFDRAEYSHVIDYNLNGGIASPMATDNGVPSTNVFSNTAYLTGIFGLNRDDPNYSGVPEVSTFIRGNRVFTVVNTEGTFTLSATKTFSNNPAYVLLDYLTRDVELGGCGYDISQVDLGAIWRAAQICDTVVENDISVVGRINGIKPILPTETAPTVTRDIKLYECNITIDTEASRRENIERILETMAQSELIWSEGKYKLVLDYPTSAGAQDALVTATYTDADIIDSNIEVSWAGVQDRFNRATVKFLNEEEDFVTDSISWPRYGSIQHTAYLTDDQGIENEVNYFIQGATHIRSALAKAEELVRNSRISKTVKLELTRAALIHEQGDLVRINSASAAINNEIFRIEEIQVTPELTVKLQLVKFDYTTLAYAVTDATVIPPRVTINTELLNVTSLTYNSGSRVGLLGNGWLSWVEPEPYNVRQYQIYARDTGGVFTLIGTTGETFFDLPATFNDGADYYFIVRTEDNSGRKSAGAVIFVDTLSALVPVTSVIATPGNRSVALKWTDANPELTLRYDVFMGTTNVRGDAVQVTSATVPYAVISPVDPTDLYFWVDKIGLDGAVASLASPVSVAASALAVIVEEKEYSFTGIIFSTAGNVLSWTSGTAYKKLGSTLTSAAIASGSVAYTGPELFVYFEEGIGTLQTTTSLATAYGNADRQVVAVYKGGTDVREGLNAPIIDGTKILAGTIGANQLVTGSAVITGSAQIGELVVDRISIKNGAVSDAGILTNYPLLGYTMNTVSNGLTWSKPQDLPKFEFMRMLFVNGNYYGVGRVAFGEWRGMTSPDGISWSVGTNQTAIVDMTDVAYGGGVYVVVRESGTGNRAATSTDGLTWTLRTTPADNSWRSVTYGNGLFVAVANTGTTANRVMTSPDGITWTARTVPNTNNWVSVTYGGGLFVAVATSGTGNRVMTSPDGITWTARTSAADHFWRSVTWGNNLFVAVASSGTGTANKVMTSPDGITWTLRTSYFDSFSDPTWSQVIFGNNLFVAVANSGTGNRIMTSPDGITWTGRSTGNVRSFETITWGTNGFLTYGSIGDGLDYYRSNNGLTWETVRGVPSGVFTSTGYGASTFVSVGNNNVVMSSADGVVWNRRSTGYINSSQNWADIAYGNGVFVIVGTANAVMTSPNAITWTRRIPGTARDWTSVTFGNGVFVAVANSGTGNRVMTSPDGITWTARVSASDESWKSVTFGNGLFVAVASAGAGNRVMTSPDGITWTGRTASAVGTWSDIAFGNGLFVAVRTDSTATQFMSSPDGITWTNRSLPTSALMESITFGGGQFVAVSSAASNNYAISVDGITWSQGNHPLTSFGSIFNVASGNGFVVLIGSTVLANGVALIPPADTTNYIAMPERIAYPVGSGTDSPSRVIFSPGLVGAPATVFVNNPTSNASMVARFTTSIAVYRYDDETLSGSPVLVAERAEKTLECEWRNQSLVRLTGDDQPEGFVSPIVLNRGIDYTDGNVLVFELRYFSYSTSPTLCSIIRTTPGFSISWSAFWK